MNLLFLDIETTGLDPKQDYILELAMLLYDPEKDLILYEGTGIGCDEESKIEARLEANPIAKAMHTKNGLLEELNVYQKTYALVLVDILPKIEQNNCMLAGSSIHFDVSFLEQYQIFSGLLKKLHYRRMDVSVPWVLWDEPIPDLPESNHRALSDCHRSLAIYKYFKSKRLV